MFLTVSMGQDRVCVRYTTGPLPEGPGRWLSGKTGKIDTLSGSGSGKNYPVFG
jgi:hypothetical protein